ncbi:MAG: hypothetical protein K9G64_06885 [Bacteroidia bacterium]|nr:hypothetical protein [Bacteroidia bacterium]
MKISILIITAILLFSCSNNQKTNKKLETKTPINKSKQAKIISEDVIKKNILGMWISNDDKKSQMIFTEKFILDIYDNKIIDTLDYVIEIKGKESLLNTIDSKANIEINYSIDYLTSKNLSLVYLDRGNTLNYTKQN